MGHPRPLFGYLKGHPRPLFGYLMGYPRPLFGYLKGHPPPLFGYLMGHPRSLVIYRAILGLFLLFNRPSQAFLVILWASQASDSFICVLNRIKNENFYAIQTQIF